MLVFQGAGHVAAESEDCSGPLVEMEDAFTLSLSGQALRTSFYFHSDLFGQ